MFSRINLWLSSLVVLPPPLPLNIHDDDRRCSLSSDWLRKYAHASCSILYQLCCGSVNCVRMKKYNYNYISERLSLLLLLHFLNGQITTILVWARRRHGTLYPADLSVYCVLPTHSKSNYGYNKRAFPLFLGVLLCRGGCTCHYSEFVLGVSPRQSPSGSGQNQIVITAIISTYLPIYVRPRCAIGVGPDRPESLWPCRIELLANLRLLK